MVDIPEVRHRSEMRYSAPSQVGATIPTGPSGGGGGGGCGFPCGCVFNIILVIWCLFAIKSCFFDSSPENADTPPEPSPIVEGRLPQEGHDEDSSKKAQELPKGKQRNWISARAEQRKEELRKEEQRKEEQRKEEKRKEEQRKEELRKEEQRKEEQLKEKERRSEEMRLENERLVDAREQRELRRRELETMASLRVDQQYLLERATHFTYTSRSGGERNKQLSSNTLIQYLGSYTGDDDDEWAEVNAWFGEIIRWRAGVILKNDLTSQNLTTASESYRR